MVERLKKLFFSTLYISAFTFGGGFVIVTFLQKKFVYQLHWISEEEMLDIAAMAQSAPGAIAVNAAILVGWNVAGFPGMLVAVLGTILPPLVILTIVSVAYSKVVSNMYFGLLLKGMQAGVAAVILSAVCDMGHAVLQKKSVFSVVIMVIAFAAALFLDVNMTLIIIIAAIAGVGHAWWTKRKEEQS